jgi:hypothetical protein
MLPRADGYLLTCEDIGSEHDSMLSLRLIVRNFHRKHGERLCRATAESAPATYEAEQRQRSAAELRIRRRFPTRFATEPRWRKVEFDPSAAPLGPEPICLQTVQLGAAKKYLERRLRRHVGPAVRIPFPPAGSQERTLIGRCTILRGRLH